MTTRLRMGILLAAELTLRAVIALTWAAVVLPVAVASIVIVALPAVVVVITVVLLLTGHHLIAAR